ncbi:MAG TPA: hypothetical protein VIW27_03595, partial [Gammaproteobacteria bacterium]
HRCAVSGMTFRVEEKLHHSGQRSAATSRLNDLIRRALCLGSDPVVAANISNAVARNDPNPEGMAWEMQEHASRIA